MAFGQGRRASLGHQPHSIYASATASRQASQRHLCDPAVPWPGVLADTPAPLLPCPSLPRSSCMSSAAVLRKRNLAAVPVCHWAGVGGLPR